MNYSTLEIWGIILALGAGTMAIRYSFLGLLGARDMPTWVLRHLRYTPVAVLPGLVLPLLIWPDANGGEVEPVRIAAGAAALICAYVTKNLIWGMLGGTIVLIGLRAVAI